MEESSQGANDSGVVCMICMEDWTTTSSHRICCLACGHLFGRSCIERWIKEKGTLAKCPTCNKPAKKMHIRNLWCKSIKAVDNSELTELHQLLENEKKLRKTDSSMIFHKDLKLEMLQSELDGLKKILIEKDQRLTRMEALLDSLRRKGTLAGSTIGSEFDDNSMPAIINIDQEDSIDFQPRELKGLFHRAERFESSTCGGCRSIAISPSACVLLVSQPSPFSNTNIFDRYGLRKYSVIDTKVREFIPLHAQNITSIDLRPVGDLVLTTGQDRRVRVTSINNKLCIQSYNSTYEPVGVAWSAHRDQQFYVTTSNGLAYLYDLRNTVEHLYQSPGRMCGSRPLSIVSTDSPEGILVNDARGTQFIEVSSQSGYESGFIDRENEHLTQYSLPFEGLMGTVDYYHKEKLALISCRRSQVNQNCAHHLLELRKETDEETGDTSIKCANVKTFLGGPASELLSRSKILHHPTLEKSVLVGACDGEARGIKLWDSSDGSEYQILRTDSFVRDMAMYTPQNTNHHLLYTLGDRDIAVYRWDCA